MTHVSHLWAIHRDFKLRLAELFVANRNIPKGLDCILQDLPGVLLNIAGRLLWHLSCIQALSKIAMINAQA